MNPLLQQAIGSILRWQEQVKLTLGESLFELRVFEFGTARGIQTAVNFLRRHGELCLAVAVKDAPAIERFVEVLLETPEFRINPACRKPCD